MRYIKSTHKQKDFNALKNTDPPIALTRNTGKIAYILHWVVENKEVHARVSKLRS